MLTAREFHGKEFYGFLQRAYDETRQIIKNFGKPKNESEREYIKLVKEESNFYKRMLVIGNR